MRPSSSPKKAESEDVDKEVSILQSIANNQTETLLQTEQAADVDDEELERKPAAKKDVIRSTNKKVVVEKSDGNLPISGLDVMASAAADVAAKDGEPVQDEPFVIDLVSDTGFLYDSEFANSVYTFNDALEFYAPLEDTASPHKRKPKNAKNVKQIALDMLTRQKAQFKKYCKGHENGLLEMPLHHFQHWFSNLRFADSVMNPQEGKLFTWHYRLIAMDPSCPGIKNSAVIETNLPKFQQYATDFYQQLFEPSKDISAKIARAVTNDKTIMIVAVRLSPSTKLLPTFCGYKKKLIVVAAVSYEIFQPLPKATATKDTDQETLEPNAAIDLTNEIAQHAASVKDVFISLLGVANSDSKSVFPSGLNSWRRNGLGLFLLIHVIKRCASSKDAEDIRIFLQCQEASALQFYSMIGFHRINKRSEDGFDLLPLHMQELLRPRPAEDPEFKSAFMFHNKIDQVNPAFLMHLRSRGLLHHQERNDELEECDSTRKVKLVNNADQVFWCSHPPPRIAPTPIRLRFLLKDLNDALVGLPLLRELYPEKRDRTFLLPAACLPVKGEVSFRTRVLHTEQMGRKWFATGEMDFMLSILSSDGRYEDIAFILPLSYSEDVRIACEAYCKHQAMLDLMDKNDKLPPTKKKSPEDMNVVIKKVLLDTPRKIRIDYLEQTKHILQKVVNPNRGMLDKQVLVFPTNEGAHWSVTFVFNPSYIQNVIDGDDNIGMLQPCFFRYCSQQPVGARKTLSTHGIPWFLNLCYSFELQQKSVGSANDPMQWYSPYGRVSEKYLLGTRDFPSLRLRDIGHLPLQSDGYNCGVGVVAAIGIILRNCIKTDNNKMSVLETGFKRQNDMVFLKDEETKEYYLMFPEEFFQPLPTQADLVWGDYLSQMREEWILFFDKIAELQHVTLPQKVNRQNAVNILYSKTLSQIATWPDKEAREKRMKMSKPAARAKVARLEGAKPIPRKKQPTTLVSSDVAVLPLPITTQSQEKPEECPAVLKSNTSKMLSKDSTAADMLLSEDAELHVMDDGVTITSGFLAQEIVDEEFNEDGNPKPTPPPKPWTKTKINNPEKVKPVILRVTTKKRKDDWLERLHLKNVKLSDDSDDEKAAVDDPESPFYKVDERAKKRKYSTLTSKTIEAFQESYHPLLEDDHEAIQLIDQAFKDDLKVFIAECFKSFKWYTEQQHQSAIHAWAKRMHDPKCTFDKKNYIRRLIRGLKEERAYYTKQFTNEFRFTRPTMVKGLRYAKENNSFYARLVYREPHKTKPTITVDGKKTINYVDAEEEIKVEEEWVRHEYKADVVQHVINMNQSKGWIDVPRDVEMRIATKKVVRVRYIAPHVRYVMNYAEMAKKIKKTDVKDPKRRKLLQFPALLNSEQGAGLDAKPRVLRLAAGKTPSKSPRKAMVEVLDHKEVERVQQEKEDEIWEKNIIRTPEQMAAQWEGKLENNINTKLDEEFVIMAFGEAYANELKTSKRGWVDVPVGDFKPSHLHEHPNLKVIGAPNVHFNQSDGKDLCVSKSLASALYALGFTKEAIEIDGFGEEIIEGSVVNALEKVIEQARQVLPSWVVIEYIPKNYDWTDGLDERHMLLGVLKASDGSCCHAVTIHGGFVYDANERIALPLCAEALNYCTSTPLVKSVFKGFRRGIFLRYKGTKQGKLAKMTLKL